MLFFVFSEKAFKENTFDKISLTDKTSLEANSQRPGYIEFATFLENFS